MGWGRDGKIGPRGRALTFPVGSPRMWLSNIRLEPLEDAGCSWWMDGKTVGRGCNLRGMSRLGGTLRAEALGLRNNFGRHRNLDVSLGARIPEWD